MSWAGVDGYKPELEPKEDDDFRCRTGSETRYPLRLLPCLILGKVSYHDRNDEERHW